MKIAVTYNNGDIALGFGHTKEFKIYEVREGKVIDSYILETNAEGHIALAEFLFNNDVVALICRNIGASARGLLNIAKISYFAGVVGKADEAVEKFLKGQLIYEQGFKEGDDNSCSSGTCSSCHGC